MATIRVARWPEDLDGARLLLNRYADFLRSNPAGPVEICMSGYNEELQKLPLYYAEPEGVLLLAFEASVPVGCVAVKRRPEHPGACEMKRLWTEPATRGTGLGRALVEAAAGWARDQGANALLLDTVAAAMPEAVRLYLRMGFRETERHNANPLSGLVFMKLELR